MSLCTAGKDVQPSRDLRSCSPPLLVCWFGDFFNRTKLIGRYSFTVELLGSIARVRLVEGIDLSLRRYLLAVGEVVSC